MDPAVAAGHTNLENRVSDRNKTLNISSKHPDTGADMLPIGVRLYCSARTQYEGNPAEITDANFSLVTTGEEIRAVTVKLEIIDPDTGEVVDDKEVTRLQ